MNKYVITGLAVVMLGGSLFHSGEVFASQKTTPVVKVANQKEISNEMIAKHVDQWMQLDSYIQRGGDYKDGEYKSFTYKNQIYRYLAADIDTKAELVNKLTKLITPEYAEQYMKAKGLIVHEGKLAQPEADGGSILQWNKAVAKLISSKGNERIYKLTVPLGDTGQNEFFHVQCQNVTNIGWRITKAPVSVAANQGVTEVAKQYIGVKYKAGGTTIKGFDSSGFTQFVFNQLDSKVKLPRTAKQQYKLGTAVKKSAIKQGDLLFFKTNGKDVSFVGIALGNGKFIAVTVSNGVSIQSLDSSYWKKAYVGAKRVLK
ncbi:NlpC/P60 family protein [Fredinandcohnia humi]